MREFVEMRNILFWLMVGRKGAPSDLCIKQMLSKYTSDFDYLALSPQLFIWPTADRKLFRWYANAEEGRQIENETETVFTIYYSAASKIIVCPAELYLFYSQNNVIGFRCCAAQCKTSVFRKGWNLKRKVVVLPSSVSLSGGKPPSPNANQRDCASATYL